MARASTLDDLWRSFVAGPHTLTESPGAREAWHRGRTGFCVWLLRLDDELVHQRVRECAARLEPWITPQQPADLHVTVWVAGFASESPALDDDVAFHVLEAQRAAVAELGTRGELEIGGIGSFSSAPFLAVHDARGCLARLRAALANHGRELRFAPYVPHVTLGLYHGAHATEEIARAIDSLRELPPIRVPVRDLELVDVNAIARAPLSTRWRIPLRA